VRRFQPDAVRSSEPLQKLEFQRKAFLFRGAGEVAPAAALTPASSSVKIRISFE